MSDSVRPHRWQPTTLPRPWDSPGKNAGVGCHFLLQCRKVKSESEVTQSCPTLSDAMDCSLPGSSLHGIFQARVLEWGAIAFSSYRQKVCECLGPCSYKKGSSLLIPALCPSCTAYHHFSFILQTFIEHLLFTRHYTWQSEKVMAPHSSTLAWKIPWTEEPGRLQSMGSLRVGHD